MSSRSDDFNPTPGATGTFICSNHFPLGKRTPNKPETDYPSVFITVSDHLLGSTPKKRKVNGLEAQRSTSTNTSRRRLIPCADEPVTDTEESDMDLPEENDASVTVPLQFEQFTREFEVRFYTGLPLTESFKCLFDFLLAKAQRMQYWRGAKQTQKETSNATTAFQMFAGTGGRHGPPRKLQLEQEFLLTLIKLILALLTEDLSFRFQISTSTTSSIFVTWVKLMSIELSVLIIWPSRNQIRKSLPNCFQKLYPKVRCIINCFERFTETPCGLDLAASMWSEYKHHYTCKALVAITPNGAISYVSPIYGGRATDIFIVKDSAFMAMLEPYDEVMADRGFKIREELMIFTISRS